MELKNIAALVTGANRGLGRALVDSLVAAGATRVYAGARQPEALTGYDSRVVPLKLDLDEPAHIEQLTKLTDLSLVINNAGSLASFDLLSANRQQLDRDLATNFFAPLALARATVSTLERNRGAMLNVLSVAALGGMPALGGYSVSKAAAFSLTQSLRSQLEPRGVAVYAAFPGPIDTDMVRDMAMTKTPARHVADAIVRGLQAGRLDIAPDPVAEQLLALWQRDPSQVPLQFAKM